VAGGEQGGRTIGCCTAAGFLPLSTPPWDPKQGSLLGTNQAGSGLVVLWLATRVRPPMVDSSESAGRSAYRATRGQKQVTAFALVDHRLGGLGGHHVRMAETFLESDPLNEAWARTTCDLQHPRLHRHFSPPQYRFPPPLQAGVSRWRRIKHQVTCLALLARTNASYFREIVAIRRSPRSIWFAPNTSLYNLPGLLLFAAVFRGQRVVCYFLSPPSRHLKACGHLARILRLRNVRFVAESEAMSVDTSQALGQPVRAILFPLLPRGWLDAPLEAVARVHEPMRIAVLGMPRREKGFHWLPSVAAELRPELASGKVCLVVQTGPEQIRRERLDAESASLKESPGVQFLESTLDPEQYLRELQRADVVFTPYTCSGYARRLSWIPIEGMALGKPVLVTDQILAADVLRKYRCGVFFAEGDIRSMASAIRRLLGRYSSFQREALRAAVSFRRDNSPDRFFGEMEGLFR